MKIPKQTDLAAFVNGSMFMGLFGPDIGGKLDDADRESLLSNKGAGPFGPEERPTGGHVTLPAAWQPTPAKSGPWITKSLAHVASLSQRRSPSRRSNSEGS